MSESEVPQEAKEKLFARMKECIKFLRRTIDDAEFWKLNYGQRSKNRKY